MNYQSKEWREARKKVKATCIVCNSEEIDVHHKIKASSGGSNEEDNLICLCKKHHAQIHTLERFYKNNHAQRSFDRLLNEVIKNYGKTKNN